MTEIVKEDRQRSKAKSGWHSSKLHLALIAIALVTGVFSFIVATTGSTAGFGEYCITVVSLVATYSGARVSESFALRGQRPSEPPAS